MTGLDVALAVIGVAYASLCMWLTIRFINRREQWAKTALIAALVAGGFVALCWLLNQIVPRVYT